MNDHDEYKIEYALEHGEEMCRDCGLAHDDKGCPTCFHENRTEQDHYFDAATCLDCGQFVALVGEEDEEGRPTWDIL